MRRREFMAGLSATAALPLPARTQPTDRLRCVRVLEGYPADDVEGQERVSAFASGLRELGWIEGRNMSLDVRFSAASPSRLNSLSAQAAEGTCDVVVATTTPIATALRQHSVSMPIVFVNVSDPIGSGLVSNLSQPGGNTTGFTNFEASLVEKWLDLLKQLAPQVAKVAVLLNPKNTAGVMFLHESQEKGRTLGLVVVPFDVENADDIKRKFETEEDSKLGLIVLPEPVAGANRKLIIEQTASRKIPAVYPLVFFARDGGLLSYGVDQKDLYFKAASYVDRILKGEPPGSLPVQLPTKFVLTINMRTAKDLGIVVPLSLLVTADEVIE